MVVDVGFIGFVQDAVANRPVARHHHDVPMRTGTL
jgi:hypothetical protein